jgi:DNA (cytosine-5)-methyltransferase 1
MNQNALPVTSMQNFVQMPVTFGSLFSGIGGLDLGFERAGFKCVWQVEINEYARRVLARHWPEVPKHDDIRTFTNAAYVDIVAGGFPCQDISYAGKGAGLAGTRSGLFYEAMRVVREVGPRFVVLENVAALLTRGLDEVLGTLASLGYDAEWDCLPASSFGASHYRNRIFIVASNANSEGLEGRSQIDRPNTQVDTQRPRMPIERHGGWTAEPAVGRVANGVPKRVDRLRGLGNAVVPQVAEYVARRLLAACKLGI